MDHDSSSKFISSLAKFLQSLCNGYVEFDSGVQVIGHLYLSVDTGKTIDYILNEKVCKTDENSVTFISNSFHAQPAEKPKLVGKRTAKESDKLDSKVDEESDNYGGGVQTEPRSTNVGTVPLSRNVSSPHSQSSKRPYSPPHKQSQSKTGRSSPKHKKSRIESLEQNTPQLSNPGSENSISSAPSPAADSGPSHSAQSSDVLQATQLSESYQQSFFNPDDDNSLADDLEDRDIKPNIDTDVTFIKEEFVPSSSCSQSGNQIIDRIHADESSVYPYQSNQVFSGSYAGSGSFGGTQRSNFSSSGAAHMFSSNLGQGSSKTDDVSGDPSDLFQSTSMDEPSVKYLKGNTSALSRKISGATGTDQQLCAFSPSPSQQNSSDTEVPANGDDEHKEEITDELQVSSDYRWSVGIYESQQPNASGMFECEKCGKAYSYRRCLQRHQWQCNEMRRLKCTLCKKEFYRSDKLRTHMRHLHRIELPRKTPAKVITSAFHQDSMSNTMTV